MKNKNTVGSYQEVFKTKWFLIESTLNNYSNGDPYYRLSCNDSVEILASTSDKKIILIRQFRSALGTYSLELPAGYIDNNESKKQAIIRELKEETGYVCESISYIGGFKIAPSRINNTSHVFFGKNAKKINTNVEKAEKEVILVSQDDFQKLIKDGKFVEMAGIALYFLVLQNEYL